MQDFLAPAFAPILKNHHLDSFAKIWQYPIVWFEAPNQRRGGWSGVGTLMLGDVQVFVKKQENHGRRTWMHPIEGEPTFRRECQNLRYLSSQGVRVPELVYYGEQGKQAILMTLALQDFVPLDALDMRAYSSKQVCDLVRVVASAVAGFHATGLMHRALYPKHMFVNMQTQLPQIAFIDLEKARRSAFGRWRTYFDLAALHRHTAGWRATQRMSFFLNYMQVSKLTSSEKRLCKQIIKRAGRT